MLGVKMRPQFNGLKLDENLGVAESEINKTLPLGIHFVKIAAQAVNITHAVNEFFIKFLVALSVVLLVTLLTLGLRVGLIVAAAVPLPLCVTFIALLLTGRNIDLISFGELILLLGLLDAGAILPITIMLVRMTQGAE